MSHTKKDEISPDIEALLEEMKRRDMRRRRQLLSMVAEIEARWDITPAGCRKKRRKIKRPAPRA